MWSLVRAALVMAVILGMAATSRAATDLSSMAPSEIEALQKRLADGGCYKGAVDGSTSSALEQAVKICPDQAPMLLIETGMHTSVIRQAGVDAACKLAVTGSDDKTVRVWSMPDGHLLRTQRFPIGSGDQGTYNVATVTRDGRYAAVAGWALRRVGNNYNFLYLFDTSTGDNIRRIGHMNGNVNHIDFSPDGKKIAVAESHAVRIFEIKTGQESFSDQSFDNVVGVVQFGNDDTLYAGSNDGSLRVYDLKISTMRKILLTKGHEPTSIAINPASKLIAVSFWDTVAVEIFNTNTINTSILADTQDLSMGNLDALSWSSDGSILVAGGRYNKFSNDVTHMYVRKWDIHGRKIGPDVPVSNNTVRYLTPCGNDIAFFTSDPLFGLIDDHGRVAVLNNGKEPDVRGPFDDFTASKDGAKVGFSIDPSNHNMIFFDVNSGTIKQIKAQFSFEIKPDKDGMDITDWFNNLHPMLHNTPIKLASGEEARSIAIDSRKDGFVIGGNWSIRRIDSTDNQIWSRSAPGDAWHVNITDEDKLVLAAYGDGTIRWHRWSDGQELLALFVDVASRKWVAWTPTGYYMASPGGEDLIGWQVNRGWEQEADFFPASRFRDRFNRPDVVRRILTTLDEGEALKQADAEAHKRPYTKPLIESLPPVIKILSPAAGASVPSGLVELRYSVRLPSGGALARVEAFVDGAKVEPRGLARPGEGSAVEEDDTVTLPMPAHDASLSLVAYGADGKAGDAAVLALKSTASAQAVELIKPSLYALLVGVSHYQDKSYDLGYAAADARGFADALKAQEGRLYGHVEVKVLADGDATAIGFKRGLSWLKRQTTAHDLALVFAAGHGTTDAKGKFWFLPTDMDPSDIDATAVSQTEIADGLYDLPGKKLLFLDACNSGAALNAGARGVTDLTAAINDFAQAEGGVVVYAAATAREFSLERPAWGHGAFTKALIEGFGGQADLLHDGTVTTGTLDLFVERRVKELTGGEQHAVMTRPKTVPDFPIAILGR